MSIGDDTLLECSPICMKQVGVATSKVSSKLCAGAPQDPCACTCYHAAQWNCKGSSVVCEAKLGAGELRTVGDKVQWDVYVKLRLKLARR